MWISASGGERERSLASNVMDCYLLPALVILCTFVDEDSDCESFVLISESGEETDDIGVTSEVTDQGRLDDVVAASATEVIAEGGIYI